MRQRAEFFKYATSAAAEGEQRKLAAVVELFRKYGAEYDVDYLLMAAQGYQESMLDQSVNSPVGAVGVMQLMPRGLPAVPCAAGTKGCSEGGGGQSEVGTMVVCTVSLGR